MLADAGYSPWVVLILILVFYLLLGCVMDSLSMILLTIPIFWPVVQELDFNFVTLAQLHAARAAEALAAGVELAPEMLAQVQATLAEGAELTREQIRALGLRRVNQGAVNGINQEQVAIWFGILVLIVVEVGLITPPVGNEPLRHQRDGPRDPDGGHLPRGAVVRRLRPGARLPAGGLPRDHAVPDRLVIAIDYICYIE